MPCAVDGFALIQQDGIPKHEDTAGITPGDHAAGPIGVPITSQRRDAAFSQQPKLPYPKPP